MNIVELVDIEDPELIVYGKLSEVQLLHYYEPNGGLFIAESEKVIRRALEAGYEPVSMLLEQRNRKAEEEQILDCLGEIPIYAASLEVLKQITGFHLTGGMLCAMRRKQLPSPKEICEGARRIAVLENVVNPTNVGAIVRSAAALNMDAVLFTPGCADPLYRRAIRVSMGNIFQIPYTYIGNSPEEWQEEGIHLLHKLGFTTAAMALCDDTLSIDDERLQKEERLAVLLGAEGDGLCQQTIHNSDYTVKIPMTHGVDSLNVAAASAVAFWQLSR